MSTNNNMPERMELHSIDVSAENRASLKQLFPSVFTETSDDKGEIVESIDFEKLKAELGTFSDVFEAQRERYGMDWPGKKEALKLIQQPSVATLKPCREESINFDTTENIFIEGDNLEVLKLLQKSYYGKVKMIYIDPPYNTGKRFVYPDKYSETLGTYIAYAGLVDDEGKKFATNTPNEGRFHTKWLNMMYPRLYLSRNLLKEDGVIFISIDDNEVNNLRKLCDEIFGEESFIAQFIWKSRQQKDNRNVTGTSIDHEYVLCYGRRLRGDERKLDQYSNPDNDPRGPWNSANMVGLLPEDKRPNCHYDLVDPKSGINYGKPKLGWRYDNKTMAKLIEENRILWPSSIDGRPRRKVFLNELQNKYAGYSSIIGQDIYTKHGTEEMNNLFGLPVMEFPKPSKLICELVEQGSDTDNIILDFFAGSCTTAHAVIDLNQEDGGNRKFVMVQLPEPCKESSEAFKAGYKTIAEIGKERIRRVIKKMQEEQDNKAKQAKSKLGFKVLKFDKSNFRTDILNQKGRENES